VEEESEEESKGFSLKKKIQNSSNHSQLHRFQSKGGESERGLHRPLAVGALPDRDAGPLVRRRSTLSILLVALTSRSCVADLGGLEDGDRGGKRLEWLSGTKEGIPEDVAKGLIDNVDRHARGRVGNVLREGRVLEGVRRLESVLEEANVGIPLLDAELALHVV